MSALERLTRLTSRLRRASATILKPILARQPRISATCPRCKREVQTIEHWILWRDHLWHLQCLAQARAWTLEDPDPSDVQPDAQYIRPLQPWPNGPGIN